MKKLVEKMSKDLKTWVVFSEFIIPEGTGVIFDEEYHIRKFMLVMEGWRFWRTEVLDSKQNSTT